MEINGTKVLSMRTQTHQPTRILPKEAEPDLARSDAGPQSEVIDENDIKWTERSEQACPMEETLSSFEPKSEKLMEGTVERWNKATTRYEEGFFIELYQQQLSVYNGLTKEGEVKHKYLFPQGAEYRFSNDD